MNLQKVIGNPFTVTCIKCGKKAMTGDETKDGQGRIITSVFYADLKGKPFKDYYCNDCANEIDNEAMEPCYSCKFSNACIIGEPDGICLNDTNNSKNKGSKR
jgi:uncharacterized protein YlaI